MHEQINHQKKNKTLVIKLGYSETLVPQVGQFCSLGDVFRSTVILHLLKNDHVTWLTDALAVPLLKNNPYIDRVLTFDILSVLQLEEERFDKVINLEKVPGICALSNRIQAWVHYGFRLDQETGEAQAYDRAYDALTVATREDVKKLNEKPWADLLFSMLGETWKGESFILGYRPSNDITHDLGFNVNVGSLIPTKAWPMEYWNELEEMVKYRYTYTYQNCPQDLYGYMNWIHSCRMLITNDSLGLYLGIALGKKVLGLFGPTSAAEQSPHPNLKILRPELQRECMPCCRHECLMQDPCINYILPQVVLKTINDWIIS